jgi:hypothetical protein
MQVRIHRRTKTPHYKHFLKQIVSSEECKSASIPGMKPERSNTFSSELTRHYIKLAAIRPVKVLAEFFMRNNQYFVIKFIKIVGRNSFLPWKAIETIANFATSLIVT